MMTASILLWLTLAAALTPEQTLQRRALSDLRLSPDGTKLALTVAEPVQGVEQNRDLYLLDTVTRALRRLTTHPKSDTQPRWSPDGKTLAFLSNRDDETQVYLLSMDGGEPTPLTEGKRSVQAFAWSPDGKHIAFLAPPPRTEDAEKKEKDKDDARVEDRDELPAQLWMIDLDSKSVRQLTRGARRIGNFVWTPAGGRLILSGTDHPQPELFTDRIFSLTVADGALEVLARPAGPFAGLKVSPDGKSLAYVGSRGEGPGGHDLFIEPLSGGERRNLTAASIDRPIDAFDWQPDGSFLVLAGTGFGSTFYTVTPGGKATRLKTCDVQPASFAGPPGALYFVGQTATRLPELFRSLRPDECEQVSRLNESWKEAALIAPEIVEYASFDGKRVEAALLKPAGYQKGVRVPLVVLVHGGPSGAWTNRFEPWGQLLAARGLAVLYPNIRGSLGYGHDFLVANRRDWGGGDFKDVLAGVDFLIQQGIADPERLGIGGWSYGGYMAAWAVTQTHRFKAAVSGAPMTDLASEYGTELASINSYDTWYLGTPYESQTLFIERSPITHVKNARTPTLILCGEKDVTDPIGQCQQFYRGLKRYDVKTELVLYPREGHGIREEKHQVDVLKRVIDWFEKNLGRTES